MSKVHLCDLAAIHSDPTIQTKERSLSFKNAIAEFPSLFAEKGWDSGQGTANSFPASAEDKKRAIAQRKVRLDEWEAKAEQTWVGWSNPDVADSDKANVSFTYGEVARAMREIWFPNGKAVEPEYILNSCIRRGFAAPFSAYAWSKHENRKLTDFAIPHSVKEYAAGAQGEMRKWLDRYDENALAGREGYAPAEMLVHVYRAVAEFGMTEAQAAKRLRLNRGQIQKLYPLAMLAVRFPSLKIVDRCILPVEYEGEGKEKRVKYKPHGSILFSGIRAAELRCLLGEPSDAKAQALSTEAMGRDNGPCTAKELETYFKLLVDGRDNAPKTIGVSGITALIGALPADSEVKRAADRERVDVIRKVLEAVKSGDPSAVRKLVPVIVHEDETTDEKSTVKAKAK